MITTLFVILKLTGNLFMGWLWVILAIVIDALLANESRNLKRRIQQLEEEIEDLKDAEIQNYTANDY